jgi:putative FmdB family regulatory protein
LQEKNMPTYGYECRSCGHSFDVFQSMSEEPLKSCPECGKEIRRLINGGTGVIFKGGGFYVTDRNGKTGGGSVSKGDGASKENSAGSAGNDTKTTETKNAGTGGGSCPGCSKPESCPKAVNS